MDYSRWHEQEELCRHKQCRRTGLSEALSANKELSQQDLKLFEAPELTSCGSGLGRGAALRFVKSHSGGKP